MAIYRSRGNRRVTTPEIANEGRNALGKSLSCDIARSDRRNKKEEAADVNSTLNIYSELTLGRERMYLTVSHNAYYSYLVGKQVRTRCSILLSYVLSAANNHLTKYEMKETSGI